MNKTRIFILHVSFFVFAATLLLNVGQKTKGFQFGVDETLLVARVESNGFTNESVTEQHSVPYTEPIVNSVDDENQNHEESIVLTTKATTAGVAISFVHLNKKNQYHYTYWVQRLTDRATDDWVLVQRLGENTTSTSDTTATAGQEYIYRIRANAYLGDTLNGHFYSNESSATIPLTKTQLQVRVVNSSPTTRAISSAGDRTVTLFVYAGGEKAGGALIAKKVVKLEDVAVFDTLKAGTYTVYAVLDKGIQIPILNYHTVGDTYPTYSLNTTEPVLNDEMAFLKNRHFHAILPSDLKNGISGEKLVNPFMIVVDDGNATDKLAESIFSKYGFKSVFSINPATVGGAEYLTWADVNGFISRGNEIASHGYRHCDMGTKTDANAHHTFCNTSSAIDANLTNAIKSIQENAHITPILQVFPFNSFNSYALSKAQKLFPFVTGLSYYSPVYNDSGQTLLQRITMKETSVPTLREIFASQSNRKEVIVSAGQPEKVTIVLSAPPIKRNFSKPVGE